MWPTLAPESNLTCTECRHRIPAGRPILSELPNPAPPGMNLPDFAAYCIGCPQCQAQGKHTCYVRRLEQQPVIAETPRSLPCARCGLRLPAHSKAPAQVFYEWPTETEAGIKRPRPQVNKFLGFAGTGTTAATAAGSLINPIPGYETLPSGLQQEFLTRGMRGGLERTPHQAQQFYQQSVPDSVKIQGPDSIRDLIDGKHASHRLSHHNYPNQSALGDNVRWEDPLPNIKRGPDTMTQQQWDNLPHRNFVDTVQATSSEIFKAGITSGFYASLLEAPIAALENYILVKKEIKTEDQALRDAAISIRNRALQGAIVGCGVKLLVVAGGGAILAPLTPILLPVGIALYGHQAIKRIMQANAAGTPLHLTGTWFCSPRCQQKLAWETGHSALLQWQQNNTQLNPA